MITRTFLKAEAARRIGLSVDTLLTPRWEKRLRPQRTARGVRLYSAAVVEREAAREAERQASKFLAEANRDARSRGLPERRLVITVTTPAGRRLAAACATPEDVAPAVSALVDELKAGLA